MARLDGYGCIPTDKNIFQRLFWFCIYAILIITTIYLLGSLSQTFSANPTVTSLATSSYPVSKVPFPGVAICSVNKISKKRAEIVANEIANATSKDPKKIMSHLHFLGYLNDFNFDHASVNKLMKFQNILDELKISVGSLLKRLTTPCEELLITCRWYNLEVDCSRIFLMRLTHNGYCCVFNYNKLTPDLGNREINTEPLKTDAGIENGLYVSINNGENDYYYTILSTIGVMVHIFSPTDYPDKLSGSINEILTQPSSENFIEIIPTTFTTEADVKYYPLEKRKCLFPEERTSFNQYYSESDCIVECRAKSIKAMCQCIPFMIPSSTEDTICTLTDIPCLNQYQGKWSSLYPDFDNNDIGKIHLLREKQDSLRCDERCYPSCTETVYTVHFNNFPIFNTTQQVGNVTRIYVYYLNRFSNLYRHDILYYWFETLSNFGGTFGILVGWSLISIIQLLLYYLQVIFSKLFA